MRRARWLAPLLLGAIVAAQSRPTKPGSDSRTSQFELGISMGWWDDKDEGDEKIVLLGGGVWITRGSTQIRAKQGVATFDVDAVRSGMAASREREGLPRRDAKPPDARKELTEDAMRARFDSLLRTLRHGRTTGRTPAELPAASERGFALFRTLYLEGGVIVLDGDREVARCERLWVSSIDDRVVFEKVELRVSSLDARGDERIVVIRAPKLVRQGNRFVGNDVSITTCTAGEPHVELLSGEAEILERGDQFEVRTRGNAVAFSGRRIVPLPSYSFFTGEQSEIPLRGASLGFSGKEGTRANLIFGSAWNGIGGSLHKAITGRDPSEFRGDWTLDLGFNEERGYPIKGELEYRAPNLYRGRTELFWLDDQGKNIREIQRRFDGSPIDERSRELVRTENRMHFSESTSLDLTLHHASDPAVWSEFYPRAYREDEIPETSAHLRSAADNRIFTLTGRFNVDGWSYTDARALAPSFVEERPMATFDVFSEPIAKLPFGMPLLLTSSTSAASLRHEFDATNVAAVGDETTRVDQELELASPFSLGPIGVRPFASVRVTHFDETNTGDSDDRMAYAAGVRAGTRFMRTWSWLDSLGEKHAIRHVVSPAVLWLDRYRVDGDVSRYRQFDEVDALTETNELRFEVLNRLQRMKRTSDRRTGSWTEIQDFLWLDIAQTILPDRDNGLGLAEGELIVRPDFPWFPLPNPRFLVEAERDWNNHSWRTANFGVGVGPVLGIDWRAEYRTDQTSRGEVLYGGSTRLFERWALGAGSQYDLDRHHTSNYSAEITRIDHDWRISLRLTYDNVADETSISLEFLPTLGGLFRPREQNYLAGSRLYGNRDFTSY